MPMIRFTDDIVVLVTSEEDLQTVMNTTLREYSLKIYAAKAKTLVCVYKTIPSINTLLPSREIVQVNYFKYYAAL